MDASKFIKFLTIAITMEGKASTKGADKAINKFGWAAIILAMGISSALILAAGKWLFL